MRDRRSLAVGLSLAVLGLLLCSAAPAQPSTNPTSDTSAAGSVPLEVFHGPFLKKYADLHYPRDELYRGGEGWVRLGFMVDPRGKAFEITVLDSTGDKIFEKAAITSVEHSTFEPGAVNGKATESADEMQYNFVQEAKSSGATPEFVRTYRSLIKAIQAKDSATASALINALKVTNLYEDAYFGLAHYYYALTWGTEAEQLAGARRAVAELGGTYHLPENLLRTALLACFTLEVNKHEYSEALGAWHRLQKLGMDAKTKSRLEPVVNQITALRSDGRAYGVSDEMPSDGDWFLRLFKQHFHVDVGQGHISEVKLYCKKRFVYFAFDSTLQYSVNPQFGACTIELQGMPGTQFTLYQF